MESFFTPVDEIEQIVQTLRSTFNSGVTRSPEFRTEQLRQLYKLAEENKQRICDAVSQDLHKPYAECLLSELGLVMNDCVHSIQHLDEWMAPQKPSVDFINKFDNCQIRYEPLGVVLIIGAWNYPIQLTLVPLVGAIAAGNCAILKPSELSPATAKLLAELIPKYLDPKAYAVVNGAVTETSELLNHRFDHILYTGSSNVGKIIMSAASKHLTPVTLELGGKSPCVVDENVDVKVAARRIAWGRFMNSGQTCIAPDYLLCHRAVQSNLVKELKAVLHEFYGSDPQTSPNYGRIVNERHFNRIKNLIDENKIAHGGKTDEKDMYIEPTILINVSPEDKSMQEEIFGPVLPIVPISSPEEAIAFINEREKPLALYVFSKNKKVVEQVLRNTSSGGAIANDVLMHAGVKELPFGGVGHSGTGAYHGKHSFDVFSHKRAVMVKSLGLEFLNKPRYPPYTDKNVKMVEKMLVKKLPQKAGYPYLKALIIAGVCILFARWLGFSFFK